MRESVRKYLHTPPVTERTWGSTLSKSITGFLFACCRQTVSITCWSPTKHARGDEKFCGVACSQPGEQSRRDGRRGNSPPSRVHSLGRVPPGMTAALSPGSAQSAPRASHTHRVASASLANSFVWPARVVRAARRLASSCCNRPPAEATSVSSRRVASANKSRSTLATRLTQGVDGVRAGCTAFLATHWLRAGWGERGRRAVGGIVRKGQKWWMPWRRSAHLRSRRHSLISGHTRFRMRLLSSFRGLVGS